MSTTGLLQLDVEFYDHNYEKITKNHWKGRRNPKMSVSIVLILSQIVIAAELNHIWGVCKKHHSFFTSGKKWDRNNIFQPVLIKLEI